MIEAVTNAIHHGGAENCTVSVQAEPGELVVTVTEDGNVVVTTGHPDVGGSRASIANVAAELLGVSRPTLIARIEKYGLKTKTNYLLAAIPGLAMVILALLVNLARIEAITIMVLVIILGDNLHQRWISGGKQSIDFSH